MEAARAQGAAEEMVNAIGSCIRGSAAPLAAGALIPPDWTDRLSKLCEANAFDEDTRQKVLSLPYEVQLTAVHNFRPSSEAQMGEQAGSMFMTFITCCEGQFKTADSARLLHFCKKWGLNEVAQAKLFGLSLEAQESVLRLFESSSASRTTP